MLFDVITLFPGLIENGFKYGVTGRALKHSKITLKTIDPRDFLNTTNGILIQNGGRNSKSQKIKSASKNEIQAMTNLCIKHLESRNFFKPSEKKPIMLENLRSIFYKMQLSEKETRILSSVFASLAKKGRLTK